MVAVAEQQEPPGEAPYLEDLTTEAIHRVIQQNFGPFNVCYHQGLLNSPNIMERVVLDLAIGRDGAVTGADAIMGRTTLWNQESIQCIVDAMRKLRFPRSKHGFPSLVYPLFLYT